MIAIKISEEPVDYELTFTEGEFIGILEENLEGSSFLDLRATIDVEDDHTGKMFCIPIQEYINPKEILTVVRAKSLKLILSPKYIVEDGEYKINTVSKKMLTLPIEILNVMTTRILEVLMYEKGGI